MFLAIGTHSMRGDDMVRGPRSKKSQNSCTRGKSDSGPPGAEGIRVKVLQLEAYFNHHGRDGSGVRRYCMLANVMALVEATIA